MSPASSCRPTALVSPTSQISPPLEGRSTSNVLLCTESNSGPASKSRSSSDAREGRDTIAWSFCEKMLSPFPC
ncbi:hypothetical protein LENED_006175 [Lentinula edodes]|uniref:Uncharacterized protein n=1 Tax=Lentinula edodes TaxID=5353 RepID=A0A1Q3EB14_LENED|nr:hypothetical protein LENED_006175 [Lentinula edodes]